MRVMGIVWQRVSTHSRPKAAGDGLCVCGCGGIVSTHSRPKAAGPETDYRLGRLKGFNTQPPEGGWIHEEAVSVAVSVSTHSRPKAAGYRLAHCPVGKLVSTHSRPKAAGLALTGNDGRQGGFNTQPPEGGWGGVQIRRLRMGRFNTQPPEGGWADKHLAILGFRRFNTQPPEGGWPTKPIKLLNLILFQHTAARRRLDLFSKLYALAVLSFQHTAARRRLDAAARRIDSSFRFQHTAARRRLALSAWL